MSTPKVLAVDARPLADRYSGYTVYLRSIIEPLLDNGWEIRLLTNMAIDPVHEYAKQCKVERFGSYQPFIWEQIDLPTHLQQTRTPLYFSGANRGVPLRKSGARIVLGLLDLIPFKYPSYYLWRFPFRFIRKELLPQLIAAWRANEIITISQQSAQDIRKQYHRAAVTPLLIKLSETKPTKAQPTKQFVYVGGVDPRKRIDNLLRAFAQFNIQHPGYTLVLVGRGYEVFLPLASELGITNLVQLPGYVSDEEKMRLIASSIAMVYPSLYEGYGLAIAEAMQAGIAVICGRGGSQAEIGGAAALYIDPLDPGDIATRMGQVINPETRAALLDRSRAQIKKLTSPEIERRIVNYFNHQAELVGVKHG